MKCESCGGSGLRADEYEVGELTADERQMLDSTRCYECGGDGQAPPLGEREDDDDLDGLVVDHACTQCGETVTTAAAWTRRPTCCGWEMVDLVGSVRRG